MKIALDSLNDLPTSKPLASLITTYQTNHKANVKPCTQNAVIKLHVVLAKGTFSIFSFSSSILGH